MFLQCSCKDESGLFRDLLLDAMSYDVVVDPLRVGYLIISRNYCCQGRLIRWAVVVVNLFDDAALDLLGGDCSLSE